MGNLCIIPARGGSKRIPRKNIKNFHGKPIISYSIRAALDSGLFDEVMVSTDDQEIADIAIKFGAKVPFLRSAETSDDYASTVDVLCEVLEKYQLEGKTFNFSCCLYATAPLLTVEKLQKGYQQLTENGSSTVFTAVGFEYPIWRGLRQTEDSKVEMVWPEHLKSRSQDLEEIFHDAGQWYWFVADALLKEKKLFTENSSMVLLDPLEVQDIDTESDWKLAELKYELLQGIK